LIKSAKVWASRTARNASVAILAVIAENIFTNLLTVVAETDIDFPVVRAGSAT
jgi:hypothetical protein